ncbi:hypothetical protein RND71_034626 [Anisodus tanguticus]|uniref:Uncharacterized protein n=1 Tax=Anisodus tanguticus TaxID=243964 RepID=A0AAE1RCY3_9SOLA|nr:hypothetical protein RND71_034626 [Anisodus tanguticus]
MASGATCVQRLDGSRDSAIHTKYRISLRSSSMREPRYPLPRVVFVSEAAHVRPRAGRGRRAVDSVFLGAFRAGVRAVRRRAAREHAPGTGGSRTEGAPKHPARARLPRCFKRVRGSFCCAVFDNDPSAGSPTETLLRLLLPLNDKVQWTSRNVAGSEPPASPRSEHFTGSFNRQAYDYRQDQPGSILADVGAARPDRPARARKGPTRARPSFLRSVVRADRRP